jgi:hypothetical protein
MKRRLNYTRRKKIPSDRVLIRVLPAAQPGAAASFEASIDLADVDLPAYGRVFLDPYVNTSSMRFSYGTVDHITAPEDRRLGDIDEGKEVLFRLLVVDESNEVGKILASTKAISPVDDQKSRQSLFPLKIRDIGEAVWAVDLEAERPCLVLNSRIPGLQEKLLAEPLLRGSIYPHALRIVLRSVYEDSQSSDDVDWVADWKVFVTSLIGEDRARDMEDGTNLDEGLDEVVREFTNRGRYAEKILFREQHNA